MKLVFRLLFFFCFFASKPFLAQSKVMSLNKIFKRVSENHPSFRLANLEIDKAEAYLFSQRGGFDPSFQGDYNTKNFENKLYYQNTEAFLKIPTWIGADIKAGYENNNGKQLPNDLTQGSSTFIGIEMPLLKDFLIDKRRASLQMAKIYKTQSNETRTLMLNDLYLQVASDYYNWCRNYWILILYKQFSENANVRLQLVKNQFTAGDRAMIDTVEAFIQWQNFELDRLEAQQNEWFAKQMLSLHLWNDDGFPYELQESAIPDTLEVQKFDKHILGNWNIEEHPSVKFYNYKMDAQAVQLKLNRQQILPQLNLGASFLQRSFNQMENTPIAENYKFGISFKAPLGMREARGKTLLSKLELNETNWFLKYKKWEIETKVKTIDREYHLYVKMLENVQLLNLNYFKMLNNESLLLTQGESNIFLVNNRENKWLEGRIKAIDLYTKTQITHRKRLWAQGRYE